MTEPQGAAPRPLRGWAAAVLLPLAAFLFGAWFIDPVVLPAARDRSLGAAIALRDRVDESEILITWTFVRPRLDAAYAEVVCITQEERAVLSPGDKERGFTEAITGLAARHPFVDVYLLAHTNLIVDWVETLPESVRAKLRMVYNSGCYGGGQADRWGALGVDAYVAHPSAASHAGFFVCFLRRWPGGERLDEVVASANAAQDRLFIHLSVLDPSFGWAREHWLASRAAVHGRDDLTLTTSVEGE